MIEGRRRGGERSTDTETSFALALATFCAACLHREPLELHEGGLLGHLLDPRLACFLISVTNSALRAFFSSRRPAPRSPRSPDGIVSGVLRSSPALSRDFDVNLGCSEARTPGIRGPCEASGPMIGFQAPEQVAANFVEGIQVARHGGRGVCGVG